MKKETDLLIIGAGPFGLAMAAHARHLGIDHLTGGQTNGILAGQHAGRDASPFGLRLAS